MCRDRTSCPDSSGGPWRRRRRALTGLVEADQAAPLGRARPSSSLRAFDSSAFGVFKVRKRILQPVPGGAVLSRDLRVEQARVETTSNLRFIHVLTDEDQPLGSVAKPLMPLGLFVGTLARWKAPSLASDGRPPVARRVRATDTTGLIVLIRHLMVRRDPKESFRAKHTRPSGLVVHERPDLLGVKGMRGLVSEARDPVLFRLRTCSP